MSRFIMPRQGVKGQNLNPADGAKLFFYTVGTTTFKDTFTDAAKSIASTNPVTADGTGLFAYIEIDGSYDVVLKDKNGVQLWGPETIHELVDGAEDTAIQELTTVTMTANTERNYLSGDIVTTKEFAAGTGGGGTYDAVLTSGITPNAMNIIIGTDNALISFVLRTNDTINPKQFGAVADGSTDDSAILQASINAAEGKTLFLGKGQYATSTTTLTISKSMVFSGSSVSFGDSSNTSEILYSGTGAAVAVTPAGKIYNLRMSNFSIRASGASTSSATAIGLKCTSINYCTFDNIVSQGFKAGTGIRVTATDGNIGGLNTFIGCFLWNNKFGYDFTGTSAGNGDYATNIISGSVVGEGLGIADSIGLKVDEFSAETTVFGTDFESWDIAIDLTGDFPTTGGGVKLIGSRSEFVITAHVRINAGMDRVQLLHHRMAGAGTNVIDNGILTTRLDTDSNVRTNNASLELLNNIPIAMQEAGGIARTVMKMSAGNTVEIGSAVNPTFIIGTWILTAPTFDGLILPTSTTAALEDVSDAINTNVTKVVGTQIYNLTTAKIVIAVGSADNSAWFDAVGVLAHSPV